jgi:hypothetical protein
MIRTILQNETVGMCSSRNEGQHNKKRQKYCTAFVNICKRCLYNISKHPFSNINHFQNVHKTLL